ncbi:GNAT family N-acetyltransferase [Actinoplanes bogorensis]|uniref:GNAT family N-acetyltransferase n=1 Tax=Paractinoplanes bogorensis TaxID=1610840 RepID=A0ABS5YV04_9ACTN|nr:GNAT family N-acetyltransferase [Actinoplanes bogorensis]MBU2666543.1 GNAT family N-acetyltransferase [Actinoplanes bogorensis]
MTSGLHEFRPDHDGDALAALLTAARGFSDVAAMMRRDAGLDDFRALIADDGSAYARTFRQPWFTPGLYGTGVTVHPSARRRGTGTALLAAITETARTLGATAQIGTVPSEGRPEALAFALSRGFAVDRHMTRSVVDPTSINPALLTAPPPFGIKIRSLDDLGDTDENRRALWTICERIAADFPNERRQPRTYEQFGPFHAAGTFVALDGTTWAGAATVGPTFYHHFTGVDRAYRGRGIATALRRATINYALAVGAPTLETHNDSTNAPMLAINRAFGYHTKPGITDVYRVISP